jgi:DNA-binding response OmpR family regulator
MNSRTIQILFPRREHRFAPSLKTMKRKLLLVDDDPSVRKMLGRLLIAEGYQVLPAANGQEALDLAAATEIDLVLLDLNLPVKNGWDTFERLTSENPIVPIIIITARPNQLFPALAAGVGALMEKPLDFPKLLETIRGLLDEPMEERLARLAGKPAEFHYLPARPKEESEP